MKKASSLIIPILNSLFFIAFLIVYIESVREYFTLMPSESLAWMPISLWVIFFMSGIFVLIFFTIGIIAFINMKSFRKFALISSILLLLSWVGLPIFGVTLPLIYDAFDKYPKLSEPYAFYLSSQYRDAVEGVAEKYGDTVVEAEDATAFQWSGAVYSDEEILHIAWNYNTGKSKMSVEVKYRYGTGNGEDADFPLQKPIEYINSICGRTYTYRDAYEMMTDGGYIERYWDGSGRIRRFERNYYMRYDTGTFSVYGLGKTEF